MRISFTKQVQCTSCYAAYHPLCGRLAGLHMNIDEGVGEGPDAAVRLISYCARHCTPRPELSGDPALCGTTPVFTGILLNRVYRVHFKVCTSKHTEVELNPPAFKSKNRTRLAAPVRLLPLSLHALHVGESRSSVLISQDEY